MPLEAGDGFISGLVATNPVGATDTKAQGDDHIRLIKEALLGTFPNVDGAVTATQAQLNTVSTDTAGIIADFRAMADPGADRVFGWDESANAAIGFVLSTGLETNGTNVRLVSGAASVFDATEIQLDTALLDVNSATIDFDGTTANFDYTNITIDAATALNLAGGSVTITLSGTEIDLTGTTLDFNGNADISGTLAVGSTLAVTGVATFTDSGGGTGAGIRLVSAIPGLNFYESDAGADAKNWDFAVQGELFLGRVLEDDDTNAVNWLQVTRSAATVTEVEFNATTLDVNANADISGTLNVGGAATLASAGVTGNATVGGTLGITGVATFTAVPRFNGGTSGTAGAVVAYLSVNIGGTNRLIPFHAEP